MLHIYWFYLFTQIAVKITQGVVEDSQAKVVKSEKTSEKTAEKGETEPIEGETPQADDVT